MTISGSQPRKKRGQQLPLPPAEKKINRTVRVAPQALAAVKERYPGRLFQHVLAAALELRYRLRPGRLVRMRALAIPPEVMAEIVAGRNAIRAWREHLGITQRELADRIGISRSTVARLEKTDRHREETKQRVAQALGIEVAQLDI